jgi:hypothetical protein
MSDRHGEEVVRLVSAGSPQEAPLLTASTE